MDLEQYIKEVFGEKCVLEKCHFVEEIPIFLEKNFSFYGAQIQNLQLTFLVCKNMDYNFKELEKHIALLKKDYISYPVLVVKNIRKERRNWLIQHHIAFIDINKQMYIPYLGMQIEEFHTYIPLNSNFSPTAQLVYIYLLLKKQKKISVKELAYMLSISPMTASRALRELLGFQLLTVNGANTRKSYQCIEWKDYWKVGEKYLTTPVLKTIYTKTIPSKMPFYLSNESALAYFQMINEPKYGYYAIAQENQKNIKKDNLIDKQLTDLMDYITVEIWKYNPGLLTNDTCIDKISLYAQLKDNDDPRIQQELKNLLKEEGICME